MKVIDPGHVYSLEAIDGEVPQELRFVKREGPGFPFNVGHHPGTTLQHVLRACLDRVGYLQKQIPCDENRQINIALQNCLYLLEHRAARRHGLNSQALTQFMASYGPMCKTCGHVMCTHCPHCGAETKGGICQNHGCEPFDDARP